MYSPTLLQLYQQTGWTRWPILAVIALLLVQLFQMFHHRGYSRQDVYLFLLTGSVAIFMGLIGSMISVIKLAGGDAVYYSVAALAEAVRPLYFGSVVTVTALIIGVVLLWMLRYKKKAEPDDEANDRGGRRLS